MDYQEYSSGYSRSNRQEIQEGKKASSRLSLGIRLRVILFSLLLSIFSVALPIFSDLATPLQSQNLYTGLMMTKGVFPYSDIFSQAGILYYAFIALSYLIGSGFFVVVIYFIAYYLSGIYLYKILAYLTKTSRESFGTLCFFYLLLASLGFGGIYAAQLALPFMLTAAWFLVRYFKQDVPDETFILFGMTGAFALLLEPRAVIFWLLASIFIFVYNCKQRHFTKGFYQFLCMIFGISIIMYTVGYFVLNMQSLGAYIKQAGWLYLKNPALSNADLWLTIVFQLVVLLCSGFIMFLARFKARSEDRWFYGLTLMTALVYMLYSLLSRSFALYPYILVVPFVLILGLPSLVRYSHYRVAQFAVRRPKVGLKLWIKSNYGLPLLLVLYSFIHPIASYVKNQEIHQERNQVATYLQTKLTNEDSIYVWDNSAKIYLITASKSSSLYPLPSSAQSSQDHENKLTDALLTDKATYVVINKNLNLPSSVSKNLSKNYKKVTDIELDKMELYQLD